MLHRNHMMPNMPPKTMRLTKAKGGNRKQSMHTMALNGLKMASMSKKMMNEKSHA